MVRFGLPHLLAFGLLALGLAGWLIAGEPNAPRTGRSASGERLPRLPARVRANESG